MILRAGGRGAPKFKFTARGSHGGESIATPKRTGHRRPDYDPSDERGATHGAGVSTLLHGGGGSPVSTTQPGSR
jgi:hypothetical protein